MLMKALTNEGSSSRAMHVGRGSARAGWQRRLPPLPKAACGQQQPSAPAFPTTIYNINTHDFISSSTAFHSPPHPCYKHRLDICLSDLRPQRPLPFSTPTPSSSYTRHLGMRWTPLPCAAAAKKMLIPVAAPLPPPHPDSLLSTTSPRLTPIPVTGRSY